MTLEEARDAIELKLSEQLDEPEVFVDVLAYNSKVYYIITQGAGLGDDVHAAADHRQRNRHRRGGGPRRHLAGVLDARCGSPAPRPTASAASRSCPINWNDIAQGASTATNYQLMPGDRLFIAQDRLTELQHGRRQDSQSVRANLRLRVPRHLDGQPHRAVRSSQYVLV